MEALKNQIDNLKAGRTMKQLKAEDVKAYYKVQGLASKLSEAKAIAKEQFISKEHLTEYKGLIIWNMKRANYSGHLNLKDAMTSLLETVEKNNVVFKTKAGIKGIVSRMAVSVALENVEANLREANGFSVLDNVTGNYILESFQDHRLRVLS